MIPRAPVRQQTVIPVTPDISDVLVIEFADKTRRELPAYETPHPDTARFPDHKLVLIRPAEGVDRDKIYELTYATDRAEQERYAFTSAQADTGTNRFDLVELTLLIPRADYDPEVPAQGATLPPIEGFWDEGVQNSFHLAARRQARAEETFDSVYVAVVQAYIRKVSLRQLSYDDEFGAQLPRDTELFYRGEDVGGTPIEDLFADQGNAYWQLSSNGILRQGEQLSANWFSVTTSRVVPEPGQNGLIREYGTNIDFSWPAVLTGGSWTWHIWARRDGSSDTFPWIVLGKEEYSGPSPAVVQEYWSNVPFTGLDTPVRMAPKSISLQTPLFSVSIRPSLHPAFDIIANIGNTDPVYASNTLTQPVVATNFPDWPSSLLVSDAQRPFRGGYLRTRVTVSPPATTGNYENPAPTP